MTATRTGGSSDSLEGRRDGAAAAETQRRHAVAALAAAQLVEQGRDDSRSRGADRVPERDRAAIDVDLVPVEPQLAPIGERLRGKRLVDLDEVELVDRHADSVE